MGSTACSVRSFHSVSAESLPPLQARATLTRDNLSSATGTLGLAAVTGAIRWNRPPGSGGVTTAERLGMPIATFEEPHDPNRNRPQDPRGAQAGRRPLRLRTVADPARVAGRAGGREPR